MIEIMNRPALALLKTQLLKEKKWKIGNITCIINTSAHPPQIKETLSPGYLLIKYSLHVIQQVLNLQCAEYYRSKLYFVEPNIHPNNTVLILNEPVQVISNPDKNRDKNPSEE